MTELSRYIDRRVTGTSTGVSQSFSAGSTTWTLPYSVATNGSEGVLVVARQDSSALLTSTRPAANQIRVTGDYTAIPVFIGVLYQFKYTLSRIYLRDPQTLKAETRGRTQVRVLTIHYTDTADLTVTVTPVGTPAKTYSKTNATPASGKLRVPVLAENTQVTIEITSSSAGPLFLSGIDWEGTFSNRGKLL